MSAVTALGVRRAVAIAHSLMPVVPAWRAATWPVRLRVVEHWFAAHTAQLDQARADAEIRIEAGIKLRTELQALLYALGEPAMECIEAAILYWLGTDTAHRLAAATALQHFGSDEIGEFLGETPGILAVMGDTAGTGQHTVH